MLDWRPGTAGGTPSDPSGQSEFGTRRAHERCLLNGSWRNRTAFLERAAAPSGLLDPLALFLRLYEEFLAFGRQLVPGGNSPLPLPGVARRGLHSHHSVPYEKTQHERDFDAASADRPKIVQTALELAQLQRLFRRFALVGRLGLIQLLQNGKKGRPDRIRRSRRTHPA